MIVRAQTNILLVIFDSLSEPALQARMDTLPTLRALQSKSLHFSRAFSCSPESSPARASLITGLDVAAHGLWTDGGALPKRETPLPEVFAQNGYVSWLVGRRQLAGVSNWTTEHARPHEYRHFDWAHGPLHRSRQNAYLNWLQQTEPETYTSIFPQQANPDDTIIPSSQHQAMAVLPDQLSFNAWIGRQVSAHLSGDTPFFGLVGFVVGKTMGSAPALLEDLDPNALRQADASLATILAALPQDTVIVVTAGRGCIENSDNAQPLQNAAINVPLLLCAPTVEPQSTEELVSTIDIAPTLYASAQLRSPQRVQGQSLISSVHRGWALSRLRHQDQPHRTAFIAERWKLVITHHDTQETQLYDLLADPGETNNLAADPAFQDRLEDMIDQMIDARVAFEDRTEPRVAMF